MDLVSFITFTANSRFVLRWVWGGIALFIPIVNFLSLGYLARTSSLISLGGMGLPTWEQKGEVFKLGAQLVYILILYWAVPCFFFSCSFFMASLGNFITAFLGGIMKMLAWLTLICCSFFVPFAFCTFSENMELRKAFEFEKIVRSVKEVLPLYILGYIVSGVCLYITYKILRIPYLGFLLSSVLTYYVLLVGTYYYTQLFRRTSLFGGRSGE